MKKVWSYNETSGHNFTLSKHVCPFTVPNSALQLYKEFEPGTVGTIKLVSFTYISHISPVSLTTKRIPYLGIP
jgi:hypothetical protein